MRITSYFLAGRNSIVAEAMKQMEAQRLARSAGILEWRKTYLVPEGAGIEHDHRFLSTSMLDYKALMPKTIPAHFCGQFRERAGGGFRSWKLDWGRSEGREAGRAFTKLPQEPDDSDWSERIFYRNDLSPVPASDGYHMEHACFLTVGVDMIVSMPYDMRKRVPHWPKGLAEMLPSTIGKIIDAANEKAKKASPKAKA